MSQDMSQGTPKNKAPHIFKTEYGDGLTLHTRNGGEVLEGYEEFAHVAEILAALNGATPGTYQEAAE